jgi:hypothetical protein
MANATTSTVKNCTKVLEGLVSKLSSLTKFTFTGFCQEFKLSNSWIYDADQEVVKKLIKLGAEFSQKEVFPPEWLTLLREMEEDPTQLYFFFDVLRQKQEEEPKSELEIPEQFSILSIFSEHEIRKAMQDSSLLKKKLLSYQDLWNLYRNYDTDYEEFFQQMILLGSMIEVDLKGFSFEAEKNLFVMFSGETAISFFPYGKSFRFCFQANRQHYGVFSEEFNNLEGLEDVAQRIKKSLT